MITSKPKTKTNDKLRSKPQPKARPNEKISILERIKLDPYYARTRSVDWYKKKINELGGNSPSAKTDLLRQTTDLQTTRILPGAMHFFAYDPKYKEDLPFYDMFPLSFIISVDGEHFTGINFHYLGYNIRMKLYEKMYLIGHRSKLPTEQITKLNWQLLGSISRFPEVRPAVKTYLLSHVRSRFIKIPVDDWATAIMLPVEKFAKKPYEQVARISTRQILNR